MVTIIKGFEGWILRKPASPEPEVDVTTVRHNLAYSVRDLWDLEWKDRKLDDPFPLQVRWSATTRDVADRIEAILDTGCVESHLSVFGTRALAGRLDEVARVFEQLPHKRLIILGDAGAGKTVLAMRLLLDLLREPDTAPQVPVLLPLGQWNPEYPEQHKDLYSWIADQLLTEYPVLAAPAFGGPTVADVLVRHRQVLPILDGLDEMKPEHRPGAIAAINDALATGDALIITSRPTAFVDAVTTTGGTLTPIVRAAVVELEELSVGDVVKYLEAKSPQDAALRWQAVVAQLQGNPSAAITKALRNPLVAWLARRVYLDRSRKPAELLATEFAQAETIRSFLLDALVVAAFSRPSRPRPVKGSSTFRPQAARRWLIFLAMFMSRSQTRDLAWWELRRAIRPYELEIVFGILAGLLFAPVMATAGLAATVGIAAGPVLGLLLGLAFVHAYGAVRSGPNREPARGSFRGLPSTRTLFRRLSCGTVTVLTAWLIAAAAVAITAGVDQMAWYGPPLRPIQILLGISTGISLALLCGLLIGLAAGALLRSFKRFDSSVSTFLAPSPRSALDRDRVGTYVVGSVFTVAVGVVTGVAVFLALDGALVYGIAGAVGGGLTGGIPAIMMFTAWAPYVPARLWLACRRRLPFRLWRFLRTSHHLEVLRQSGAVYQFRHALLQDRLAGSRQ